MPNIQYNDYLRNVEDRNTAYCEEEWSIAEVRMPVLDSQAEESDSTVDELMRQEIERIEQEDRAEPNAQEPSVSFSEESLCEADERIELSYSFEGDIGMCNPNRSPSVREMEMIRSMYGSPLVTRERRVPAIGSDQIPEESFTPEVNI